MPHHAEPHLTRWVRFREDLGILLWASFLAACFATLVFFALFDPSTMGDGRGPYRWLMHRSAGYTIGFFFFWAICAISGFITAWMIDTRDSASEPQ
jgi:hypothetical protein